MNKKDLNDFTNKVIEECAKVCELLADKSSAPFHEMQCAHALRMLKKNEYSEIESGS